ncbi:SDR family NAD(P)-dependent oxidoreductase [Chloroflexota bacterium]
MKLANRLAIVTGAASGIGRAIALALAREGASVAIADINVDAAQAVANEIRELGAEALAICVDISQQEKVEAMVDRVVKQWSDVNILINNAAFTFVMDKYFHETDPIEWDPHINVTFKGTLYCCRAVIPSMINSGWGRIINITSYSAKTVQSRTALYSACKAAIAGLSRCLASELARYGIRVNCVAPGATRTASLAGQPQELLDKLSKAIPLRRLAEPEDIASMVLFLASEEADYITGQNLSVDGGVTYAL